MEKMTEKVKKGKKLRRYLAQCGMSVRGSYFGNGYGFELKFKGDKELVKKQLEHHLMNQVSITESKEGDGYQVYIEGIDLRGTLFNGKPGEVYFMSI